MIRNYRLIDLDCANCAAKMEREIAKIKGVNKVTVNFMTTKMTIDADDERIDEIEKEAQKIVKKFESEVTMKRI